MASIPFLSTPLVYSELEKLRKLLVSSYGPRGRMKMIIDRNSTKVDPPCSSFSHLLRNWQVSNPFIRVVVSSANNHLSIYGDGGKFITIFCIAILKKLSGSNFESYLLTKMLDHITVCICEHLNSQDCSIMVRVDLDELHKILAVVGTIVSSKSGCNLSYEEVSHLSILILKGFLYCVPCYTGEQLNSVPEAPLHIGNIHFHTIKGCQPVNSSLTSGILFACQNVESTKKTVSVWKANGLKVLTVALFVTALDGSAVFDGESLEISHGLHVEETVTENLMALGQRLVERKVNLLACQKAVHPMLMSYLNDRHCLVLDRLGTEMTETIKLLTGAEVLSRPTASSELPPNSCKHFGKVQDVKVVEYGGKEFLLLNSADCLVYTILLCNLSEEALVETKFVCQQALQAVYRLIKSKQALLGGGCAESVMAVYIRNLVKRNLLEYCSSLKCSKEQLTSFTEMFASVLEEIAVTSYSSRTHMRDDTYYHLWEEESSSELCMCGMLKRKDPSIKHFAYLTSQVTTSNLPAKINNPVLIQSCRNLVLDESFCRINAWRVALETASLLLNTGLYIIKD